MLCKHKFAQNALTLLQAAKHPASDALLSYADMKAAAVEHRDRVKLFYSAFFAAVPSHGWLRHDPAVFDAFALSARKPTAAPAADADAAAAVTK